jgi:hypothetical protein
MAASERIRMPRLERMPASRLLISEMKKADRPGTIRL